ncbi:Cloroperoxidase [Vararia minispora EC-137]|uniref:Cloroperoxidase n=1 Tax=Vararia minispora EC-137 TaxID=1314806 RepID=A0ACB8QTC6_9AGAM|nr:Cloroperoxidase [Vararia minispora EC-137]
MTFILTVRRLSRALVRNVFELGYFTWLMGWDFSLFILNIVTPKRPEGKVVYQGNDGHGGIWPEYIPPAKGASRCSCPALNAMANHGIIARDGRNISFKELSEKIIKSYNFSPTFCLFVPRYIAHILGRSYTNDRFDLADIDVHNGIEHDASLFRDDTFHTFYQGLPSARLVTEFLACATGPAPKPPKLEVHYPTDAPQAPYNALTDKIALDTTLTKADLSRAIGRRRVEAKQNNPQYSQDFTHKNFGSSNASTLLLIFGGRTRDLATFLIEERLPTGWEPRLRDRFGLTLTKFNMTVFPVEMGIKEEVEEPLNLM